ncbi:UvrD-helicase domain-containing protein [Chroococcidiopsis sp.]|uniref:UvrD-helicase domain-containing protein n=1 Tax=Chroococcidiopsis sp. TaxID=3088168 RepID=UPI003F3A5D52
MQILQKTFTPSHYQQAIFNWIKEGRGDAVVKAAAGSGKTSTLVEASKLLYTDSAIFLAFNKHIADELSKRVSNMICKTIHSIGHTTLRSHLGRVVLDENKYLELAKLYAEEIAEGLRYRYIQDLQMWNQQKLEDEDIPEPDEPPTVAAVASQLKQLAHFIRVTLTDVSDRAAVEETCYHYSVLENDFTLDLLYRPLLGMLREGDRLAGNRGVIDYDDMLYLPHAWGLIPKQVQWVMCDEAQDLSPAQLDLVLKLRSPGGRMLFVGDESQAIFGFAGASSESIQQIIKRTNATVLPLSICYRCPSSHIKLAQTIVPTIVARENAPEGIIEEIKRNKVSDRIQEGDLVISRCTAPVIKLCIELIAKRIPARVRGRDIGKSLTTIVKEVAKHPDFTFDDFGIFLKEYEEKKVAKLEQKKNAQSQIESLRDRIQGIEVCFEAFEVNSVEELCREIESLFSDGRASVMLSTVHRCKGLENDRVFILQPDKLPLKWQNQQEWERTQEANLQYVAYTRAKQALYFIK